MRLDLKAIPAVIRASGADTLRARGCRIVNAAGEDVTTDALRELGNNVAQALVSIDLDDE